MSDSLQPGTHQERQTRKQRTDRTRRPLNQLNTQLVNRLIGTLHALEEAGDPKRSTPIEGQMRVSRANSEKDEGAATRWARQLEYRIHNDLKRLLNEHDQKVQGDWKPRTKPAKVRCIYKTCEVYGKRIPRYVGPNNEIELVRCPKCDKKLVEE